MNLKKVSRSKFVSNEKKFDKYIDTLGKGGKSAKVCFYLDISYSMKGQKILTSVNYLKSFYDQMHKYLEIRMFAFGQYTYEITRNELNYTFLEPLLEGDTRPQPIKLKRGEEIIFITDGEFGTTPFDKYMRNAHFVLVDFTPSYYAVSAYQQMRHKYHVAQEILSKD